MTGLHVGIIMDGNGRWARSQGYPRWRGHFAGVDSVREIVRASPDLGISTLTLYAFSADNWKRPAMEVGRLFWLLREYCRRESRELKANGVALTGIGRRDRIPGAARRELETAEQATAGGTRLTLRLAVDYSAQWTIAEAARTLAHEVRHGLRDPDDICRDALEHHITGGTPPVDLLIRTAGEQRLSDFLLWETAYAELYFTPVLWPEFRPDHLAHALDDFRCRERKFGALPGAPNGNGAANGNGNGNGRPDPKVVAAGRARAG
ncbi:MAG TPA: polyprenyl diphosphate synthase [Gemmatimonadales bacterium]|nr:polyprenyl diphosphate synthase [Gemmatimonadales bacterium]